MNSRSSLLCPEIILEKVADIALRLQQKGDLGSTIQAAIADVRALLQTDRVLIYHFLEDDDFVALESVGAEWLPILGRLPDDHCFETIWMERYQQGQITAIADIHSESVDPDYAQRLKQLQVQANLVVPIFSQGTLWGLLIAHHCRSPRAWQPLEIQLLQHVALHLVIATEQVALRQRQQHLEQQLEQYTLERHSGTIATQSAPNALVQQAAPNPSAIPVQAKGHKAASTRVYEALPHLDASRLAEEKALRLAEEAVRQQNHQLERKRLQAQYLGTAAPDGYRVTQARGIMQKVHPAIADQLAVKPDHWVGKPSLSFIAQPDQPLFYTQFKQRLRGSSEFAEDHTPRKAWKITFRPRHGKPFPAEVTVMPLDDRSNSIACLRWLIQIITDHKRLEAERKAAAIALRQYAEYQRGLTTIAQTISHPHALDHILQTTVTEVRQLLHTDRVIIYRSESDGSGSIIAESVGEGWRSILGMQITSTDLAETLNHSHQQGSIQATNDIYTANLNPYCVTRLEQMQVRAKLRSPILQADHVWGLLDAQHCRAPRQWTVLEMELLQHLAIQIEIAIQQAALYEQVQTLNASLEVQVQDRTAQLQQALEFEALLKRITDQVRDSLDEAQILQKVVQELAIALQADCCDTTTYNADRTIATVQYAYKYSYNEDGFTTSDLVFAIADSADPNLYTQLFQGHYGHFCSIGQQALRPDPPRQSILVCPMLDDQGVCGDLRLFKSAHESFNDLEVRLVQQVANQCAIALRQSRLYQAAQAQVQELERLNQLKDDFLCTVSHELRSPMSSIKMATQMLEISLDPLGILEDEANSISRYFKILREEGQREVNLINDLLDLTRLDAGTEPLQLTTIALQCYIPHLAEPFVERARQYQRQFTIQIPDDLPPLTTDLPYLERLLTELLQNACKYTPAGETITIAAQATSESLEIRVSNSGVEIPAAECDRIFDKFYRIPNSDPWKHGGTGLGLALVKKITARLGGQIHVESGAGQTTFVLKWKC